MTHYILLPVARKHFLKISSNSEANDSDLLEMLSMYYMNSENELR